MSLIVIATLTESCAQRIAVSPGPSTLPVFSGVQEIDPSRPPRDGVWMTWQDASAMAVNQRNERLFCQERELLCKKELAQLSFSKETMEKQIKRDMRQSWWYIWGCPVGIVAGVLIGSIVPIAIMGSR